MLKQTEAHPIDPGAMHCCYDTEVEELNRYASKDSYRGESLKKKTRKNIGSPTLKSDSIYKKKFTQTNSGSYISVELSFNDMFVCILKFSVSSMFSIYITFYS